MTHRQEIGPARVLEHHEGVGQPIGDVGYRGHVFFEIDRACRPGPESPIERRCFARKFGTMHGKSVTVDDNRTPDSRSRTSGSARGHGRARDQRKIHGPTAALVVPKALSVTEFQAKFRSYSAIAAACSRYGNR